MAKDKLEATEIVEVIMTQHWDIAACQCWICKAGREIDLHPTRRFLPRKSKYGKVRVEEDKVNG